MCRLPSEVLIFDCQFILFLRNLCLRFHCRIIGFFIRCCLCNFNISLTLSFCDGCRFLNLYNIVDTEIFNDIISINEILHIETDDIQSHRCQIRLRIFFDKVGKFLTVGNHFLQPHLTNNLTHITFKHFTCHTCYVLCIFIQKVLCCQTQFLRIITDLDIDRGIHIDIDVIRCRYGVTRLDINRNQTQIQFIQTLKKRNPYTCLSNDNF